MASSVRCVVFDLDDTLYLERDYVRSGFSAVGDFVNQRFGLQGFSAIAWKLFESGHRGDIFDRSLAKLGGRPQSCEIEELVEIYRNHEPSIALEPDALKCLSEIFGRVSLALITDGPLSSQKAKAEALQVEEWIEHRVFTADLGPAYSKPHPRAFELVQDKADLDGASCVYVADNPLKDFSGPRSLGWKTIRIRRPTSLHSRVETSDRADKEVTDLVTKSILGGFSQGSFAAGNRDV